jgi:gluconolactonase
MTDTALTTTRRYPDPAVRILDPRFTALRLASASVECLFQGTRWSEGPVWFGDGRYLLWSDIPNNRRDAVPPSVEQLKRQYA